MVYSSTALFLFLVGNRLLGALSADLVDCSVTGQVCNAQNQPITGLFNSGDQIRVCVQVTQASATDGYEMNRIDSLKFALADGTEQSVTQGEVNCQPGQDVCTIETVLGAGFYDSPGEFVVTVTGQATCQIDVTESSGGNCVNGKWDASMCSNAPKPCRSTSTTQCWNKQKGECVAGTVDCAWPSWSGCWGNTLGPCKIPHNNVCQGYSYVSGPGWVEGQCPTSTSLVSENQLGFGTTSVVQYEKTASISFQLQVKGDEDDAADDEPLSGGKGDPHFITWQKEHYEYHGQCDLVLVKDESFANGLGLRVHIRTQIVRFWSYNLAVSVTIGDDILEVEGSADSTHVTNEYWFNYEYQGDIDEEIGGFPITYQIHSPSKRSFTIDLDKIYSNQKIVLSTWKEFVRVDFVNGNEDSFGNSTGLLGEFKTGKLLARDGVTELNDFYEFGSEWQVQPAEPMLFHMVRQPQFPARCIEPDSPRGQRARRRLNQVIVTEDMAEKACAHLKRNSFDYKDCVYDVLATQDLDMVGAY